MQDEASWLAERATRPLLRGWLHAGALVPTAVMGTWLAAKRPKHRAAIFTHTAGFASMLAASAAYHRLPKSYRSGRVLRKADHALIFAAMAGTMTPVATVALPQRAAKITIGVLWLAAAVGAALKVTFLGSPKDPARYMYLPLGWSGVVLVTALWEKGGVIPSAEFLLGGLLYSAGSVTLATHKPDFSPSVFGYHELWHVATLLAGAVHFDAVRRITDGQS